MYCILYCTVGHCFSLFIVLSFCVYCFANSVSSTRSKSQKFLIFSNSLLLLSPPPPSPTPPTLFFLYVHFKNREKILTEIWKLTLQTLHFWKMKPQGGNYRGLKRWENTATDCITPLLKSSQTSFKLLRKLHVHLQLTRQ